MRRPAFPVPRLRLPRLRRPARRLAGDTRGIAAVEFAFVAPVLVVMIVGILELSLRFRAIDAFERYVYQAGDFLSRADELQSADIDAIYNSRSQMMTPVPTASMLDLEIASIGIKDDGSAIQLWRRHRGQQPGSYDVTEAEELGDPGESVMRVSATYRYTSPIGLVLGSETISMKKSLYFRPRVTRLIAIDGDVADPGVDWEDNT